MTTVCPCCGFKFEGDLRVGCTACGARAVGEPLSRPEHELPFYGRALFVGAVGALMLVAFLVFVIVALFEDGLVSPGFKEIILAAKLAAWRLKWAAIPATVFALWTGARLCAGIRRSPKRFAGTRIAHGGLATSALVVLMLATLIGVTVPQRLRQRRYGIEAGMEAQAWSIINAQEEYRARYKTYAATIEDLKQLPDPNGSLRAALAGVNSNSYQPTADVAALPPKGKPRSLRGAALRNASAATADDLPGNGVPFNKYELHMAREDKKLDTEDDWIIRDGVIIKPSTQQSSAQTTDETANLP